MKNNNYVEKDIENNVLLTPEEIKSDLNDETDTSIIELQQFIYNLSIVLYKSFNNGD